MLLIYAPADVKAATDLAQRLGVPSAAIDIHRFPDEELRVTLPQLLPDHILVFFSLHAPNEKLITLMLTVHGARSSGVRRVTLLAPYLCYMRQDMAFHPGEVISQRAVGSLLANLVDDVITVDPHLHRIDSLEQVMPGVKVVTLSAAPVFAEYLKNLEFKPLLFGPDAESRQWVDSIASQAGLEFVIAEKVREGDAEVRMVLPEMDYRGRDIVIVDDVISTGTTVIKATALLKEQKAASVRCLVTHGLFDNAGLSTLHRAGIDQIISTETIQNPTAMISLSDLYLRAVRALAEMH